MREKKGECNRWLTPPEILEPVRDYFQGPIPLDPCTEPDNPTEALNYLAIDGLRRRWAYSSFVNPPYSKLPGDTVPPIRRWAAKIHDEAKRGTEIIALLPCGARFSTGYWQDHVLTCYLDAVCFVRGRVSFINAETGTRKKGQNNYDSMIYGYNIDVRRFMRAFGTLGCCTPTSVRGGNGN